MGKYLRSFLKSDDPETENGNTIAEELFFMILLIFLAFFFIIEAYIEKTKPIIGHTTGVIVLMGILVSFLFHNFEDKENGEEWMKDLQFSPELFFDLLLPLIIFPSGYNMRRKKFFKNIGTIIKFGFLGTLICFAVYTGMCYGALQAGWLTKKDPDGNRVALDMGMFEVLSICALLCSSDVIAAISMISYTD